jgi:hypothetical protein
MKLGDYFEIYPEDKNEYYSQKSPVWNKGLTKETSESVAIYASKIKSYTSQQIVREQRSNNLKKRYENGDILNKEQRKKVVKAGSDGWVNKLKNSSKEQRKKLLQTFTEAGNIAQYLKRQFLTPEDYMIRYPWALGHARYYNCDFCGKQMIAWFGGKKRPRKRFCDKSCFHNFKEEHPCYGLGKGTYFFSNKMQTEFYLHSRLETWFAELCEESNNIKQYSTIPFFIPYVFENKKHKYYADFFVNGEYVIELKSKRVYDLDADKTEHKLLAARNYCQENNYRFVYWQFDDTNYTKEKMRHDDRVAQFFLG